MVVANTWMLMLDQLICPLCHTKRAHQGTEKAVLALPRSRGEGKGFARPPFMGVLVPRLGITSDECTGSHSEQDLLSDRQFCSEAQHASRDRFVSGRPLGSGRDISRLDHVSPRSPKASVAICAAVMEASQSV
jgi:hypothetical protein